MAKLRQELETSRRQADEAEERLTAMRQRTNELESACATGERSAEEQNRQLQAEKQEQSRLHSQLQCLAEERQKLEVRFFKFDYLRIASRC